MTKEDLFQDNCELWALQDPKKALMLQYQTFPEGAKDKSASIDEAAKIFSSLDLSTTDVLYIYGLGKGFYYESIKDWLHADKERRLIFIEDDLAMIDEVFHQKIATTLLQDPQVTLYFYEGLIKSEELFYLLYWNSYLKKIKVVATSYNKSHQLDVFEELQQKLEFDASIKDGLLQEYLEYGIGFYKNFYPNILSLQGSYLGDGLKGKFKNVPAIICGAGPSLEKNIEQLKDLTDKALIFAGGSALNVLNALNIEPHFALGIDPNPMQYERLNTNTTFEVPFLYRNRLYHPAFKTIHGPRVYITGSGGYDTASFYEKEFKIKSMDIEEGHNVVNFGLEIAHQFGCNPIIFVGMDLGFTDLKAYASGVLEDSKVTKDEILKEDNPDYAAILRNDIFGKPIYTLWKWIAESNWISDFAKEHPKIKVINATEGGIGFDKIDNIPLKIVEKDYLKNNYDLLGKIHANLQKTALTQVKKNKLVKLTHRLLASLNRCLEGLNILSEEADEIIRRMDESKEVPAISQTGKAALYESELAEEEGYLFVLHMFNEAYTRVLNKELQQLQCLSSEVEKAIEKQKILKKRFEFLQDVAKVNIEFIKWALENDKDCQELCKKAIGTIEHTKTDSFSTFSTKKEKLAESSYKDGSREGKTELFYPDGSLYSHQFYKDGLKEGIQTYYYPNGVLRTELEYKKGCLKKAQLYTAEGKIYKTI